MFKFFKENEKGDVAQYIIVLAVIAIICAYSFPLIKGKLASETESTLCRIDEAFSETGGSCSGGIVSGPDLGEPTADPIEIGETSEWTFAYSGSPQTWKAPKDGNYRFEAWGASGGIAFDGIAGSGGYSGGDIYLDKDTVVYVYVGGEGYDVNDVNSGGYNGGGGGHGGGGGATDFRLTAGAWDNLNGLKSRILVAGGGGGAERISGGDGGGLTGETGEICYGRTTDIDYYCTAAEGGSQIQGGGPGWHRTRDSEGQPGLFGIGGSGVVPTGDSSSGGGGGYYGGGGVGYANGAGGGSSFISGHQGSNAIYPSGTHNNQPNHYSGYIFSNTSMTKGGNVGNGKAKITSLD